MRDDVKHRQQLLFIIRKSIRYHNARRLFYERLHSLSTAACVIFATATTIAVMANVGPYVAAGVAGLVTLVSVLDLVIGTVSKARMHQDLARRHIALEKLIINKLHPNAFDLTRWEAERLDIQADEPPVKQVLDAIVFNELLQAYGAGTSDLIEVKWYQRWFAHFFDVHVHRLVDRKPRSTEILAAVEPVEEPVELDEA